MSVAPVELDQPQSDEVVAPDSPWVTLVWNDPVEAQAHPLRGRR